MGEAGRLDAASVRRVIDEIVAHRNDFVGRVFAAQVLQSWQLQRVTNPGSAPAPPPATSTLN